jgi:hypothetical protein
MAEKPKNRSQSDSDEIDLGQLFRLIGQAFQGLFNALLSVFLYLKRNLVILLILAVVGFAIGFTLSKIITKKQKIQVIVKPNWESKNYLYDVIGEVQANLEAKDTTFFRGIGVHLEDFGGYKVEIEPVNDPAALEEKAQIEYLELLQKFENTGIVADVLRAEILDKSSLNHRVTFTYKNYEKGPELAGAVIKNLNLNNFYKGLTQIHKENAETRISENKALIDQIDRILDSYTKKMADSQPTSSDNRIVLSTEEELNVSELLEFKSNLIRDTERMKVELLEQAEPINIINFGKPQQVRKPFFGKNFVLLPTIFILLFLLFDFLRFLNRRSAQIHKTEQ